MKKGRALQALERRPLKICAEVVTIALRLFADDDGNQCQNDKHNTEDDRDPEQGFFNPTTG